MEARMTLHARQKGAVSDIANPMVDLSSTRAPIYLQLSTLFRRFIVRSQWPVGDRIPTHDALAMQFGVNPATVRKAIDALEAEGLVACSRRRGTFVIAKPSNAEWYEIATTWEGVMHAYDGLAAELLETDDAKEIPGRFQAGGSSARRYRYTRRLYRRGSVPLVVEDSYLDKTLHKKINRAGSSNTALLNFVDRHARVERADQTLRFGIAGREISQLLELPLNAPLALVHLSVFAAGAVHCFESTAYIRGDMVRVAEPIRFSKKSE